VGSKEIQEYGWWLEEGKEVIKLVDLIPETWTKKYKKSIDCSNPKGFSQRAHCAGRRKRKRGGQTKSKPV
jgi:hypothetical protein